MALRLPRPLWEQMRQHVAALAPQEACGLLAGEGEQVLAAYPVRNELASQTHFRMDPAEQWAAFQAMEAQGWDLLAIYHSHPTGPARPSRQDALGAAYPGAAHFIWTPVEGDWDCRAFGLENNRVVVLEFNLQDE
ncbi:MAG: M67 family metallopeptidase [Anaerolineales bacterium]|nr:M67 family metallopeptidase [Anaerolineales bacterium]